MFMYMYMYMYALHVIFQCTCMLLTVVVYTCVYASLSTLYLFPSIGNIT